MRNALRDAELPPPAGGWERLQRELGGAAPGPEVSGTKPRGSVWRIYRPRIAAAAAAVLILAVAGEFLLRPDKALENDGTVIASVAEDGATAVAIPQPAEPEIVRDALAKAVGLPREQVERRVASEDCNNTRAYFSPCKILEYVREDCQGISPATPNFELFRGTLPRAGPADQDDGGIENGRFEGIPLW